VHKNLTDRLEGIDKFVRHNRKWENSIEILLKEVAFGVGERSVDWLIG
jgi:hypothetical protein